MCYVNRGNFQFKRQFAAMLLPCFFFGTAFAGALNRTDGNAGRLDTTTNPIEIVYPSSHDPDDKRSAYYVKLLDLAMSKTGVAYNLHPFVFVTFGARIMQKMQDDEDINVTWELTSPEWEKALAPVRISLDKGILGWRLFLINKRDEQAFAKVQTLNDLRQYSAGQQRDWSDVAILRANGLKVVDAAIYNSMFKMLAADRFQYFPRGVGEIWGEAQRSADLGIEIEPTLALHYPVHTYFFVSKKNLALHRLLDQGLRAAIKDGSFDKLFDQYNGEAMTKAHFDTRRVFELTVPE